MKSLKIEFTKTEDRTERKIKASVRKEQSDKVGWYCTVHDYRDDAKTFLLEILRKKIYETNLGIFETLKIISIL